MNKNFWTLFTLSIIAIVLVSLVCFYTFYYYAYNLNVEKSITNTSDVIKFLISISTFIIALLIYDRFGFRKKLYEKKLEIVLDLLVLLKQNVIFIRYYNNAGKKSHTAFKVYPNKNIIDKKFDYVNIYSYVVFDGMTIRESIEPIMKLKNNPFLPVEISKSLNFMNYNELWGVDNDPLYLNEYTQINFNNFANNKVNSLDGWYRTNEHTTLKTLLENYQSTFMVVETWLDKHSNIKSELNI